MRSSCPPSPFVNLRIPVGTGRVPTSRRNGSAGAWRSRRPCTATTSSFSIGSPTPVARDLAVDGIDEWIGVHLATEVPESPGVSLGGVLCLACADVDAAWTVEITAGRLRWRDGRGPADAVLVGSASDLYLYCWNRRPLEVLELTGNRQVATAWSALAV